MRNTRSLFALTAVGALLCGLNELQAAAGSPSLPPGAEMLTALRRDVPGWLALSEPVLLVTQELEVTAGLAMPETQQRRLTQQLDEAVGSGLSGLRRPAAPVKSLAEARALARQLRLQLLVVSPRLEKDFLTVKLTHLAWPSSFWQRALVPAGQTLREFSLRGELTPDLRPYFPRTERPFSLRRESLSPISDAIALYCGPLGNETAERVLFVGRRELVLGHRSAQGFTVDVRKTWNELSPLAGAPLKSPLANVQRHPRGFLVGASDRSELLLLDPQLKVLERGPRALPDTNEGCHAFSDTGFKEARVPCALGRLDARALPPRPASDPLSLFSLFEGDFRDPKGVPITLVLRGFSGKTETELRTSEAGTQLVKQEIPTGSVLLTADFDGNGLPEIVAGNPEDTNIGVYQFNASRSQFAKSETLELGSPSASAICPYNATEPETLLIATKEKLWLLK